MSQQLELGEIVKPDDLVDRILHAGPGADVSLLDYLLERIRHSRGKLKRQEVFAEVRRKTNDVTLLARAEKLQLAS